MADNFGLKIGIEGEKEFKNALREINQSFRVLGSEMKLVTSEFSKNDKSIQAITARNNQLNKEIDAQREKVSTLEKALNNAASSFGENDRRTLAWQTQLNNANAELNNMERELKESQEEVKKLNKEKLDKLVGGLKEAGDIAGKVLVAGGMDLARASDLVTDSMAALGLETSQMGEYMDIMARTSQKSNTNVQQLGEGILVAGVTMKNAGQELDNLNVMLGVLANRGIKGSEGGTKLRNIIMSLASPTAAADKVIDIKKIPGVIAPVTGATPVTTAIETAQYIGNVTWSPVDDSFKIGTEYTATITLTAKGGFTLDGVSANFFTVNGIATTHDAGSGVVTVAFPKTELLAGPDAPPVKNFSPHGGSDIIMLKNDGTNFKIKAGTNMIGQEYSKGESGSWGDLDVDTEITVEKETILIRAKETDTHKAEEAAKVILTTEGYVFNSNTGTILSYAGTATELTIPDTIDGINVKAIDDRSFGGGKCF